MRWFPATPPPQHPQLGLFSTGPQQGDLPIVGRDQVRPAIAGAHRSSVATLAALTYPVQSEAVRRIPNPIEFERE
jgi:hypothetical protein